MFKITHENKFDEMGTRVAVEVEDASQHTWMQLLDISLKLLKAAGYSISHDKLISWAEETDEV